MYEIMKHIRNFFAITSKKGEWTINNGSIVLPFLYEGQYFLIEGSKYNDYKVYKYGTDTLTNESFEGFIVALDVPKPFVDLCAEITAWKATAKNADLVSESFGGYSYTKATGSNGAPLSWQGIFKERLNEWRKI